MADLGAMGWVGSKVVSFIALTKQNSLNKDKEDKIHVEEKEDKNPLWAEIREPTKVYSHCQ